MVVFAAQHSDYLLLNELTPSAPSPSPSPENGPSPVPPSTSENGDVRNPFLPQPNGASSSDKIHSPVLQVKIPKTAFRSGSAAGLIVGRTGLEKVLLLAVLLAVIIVGILTAALINTINRPSLLLNSDCRNETPSGLAPSESGVTESTEICTSPGCVSAAAYLLASIDTTADPCDNFYQYACGKWNQDNPIPDDKSRYGTFSMVRERLSTQMKELLENNNVQLKTDSSIVNMSRQVYQSCMNMSQISEQRSRPVMEALTRFGGWPLLNSSWTMDGFDLTSLLAAMKKEFTADPLWSTYVYADAKNTSRHVIHIDQPSLSLFARDYYLNDTMHGDLLHAYVRFIRDTAILIGRDAGLKFSRLQLKEMDEQVVEVLEFERKLANLSTAQDERRNASALYNQWTLQKLSDSIVGVNWTEFFNGFLPQEVRQILKPETPIVIMEPNHIIEIVQMATKSPPRVVANYLMWRLVKLMHRILDERFQDIYQDFMRVMMGRQQKSPRWKECVQSTITSLDMASGAMYVEKYFNSKDKKEALDMIENLLSAFQEILEDLSWMDDATKKIALEKVTATISHIGYPEFVKNASELREYYDGLALQPKDTYVEIVTKISLWHQEKVLSDLLKPFDRHMFDIAPAVVNAFYSPEKNAVMFPAGLLQPPFFRGDYPKAVNYGAMGTVIGHELTHGFDDQGSQYDPDGNLNNWWSPIAFGGFRNRTKCMVDQYSSYKLEDVNMKINGKLTQGENIADNGGVKEAYKAYRKYIQNRGAEEPQLPGLNLTNNQVFFMSFASFWCGNRKPQAAVQQILTDSHSPEMYRVIGVMSNLDEFAAAYKCPAGSPMNPLKSANTKCMVW